MQVNGSLAKKMAGYHQFHAVQVAVGETLRAAEERCREIHGFVEDPEHPVGRQALSAPIEYGPVTMRSAPPIVPPDLSFNSAVEMLMGTRSPLASMM